MCADNYTGERCADCADGALRINGRCVGCDVAFLALSLLVLVIVIVLVYLYRSSDACTTWMQCFAALDFLQVIAILSTTTTTSSAPTAVTTTMNVLTVFNPNPALFTSSCWGGQLWSGLSSEERFQSTFTIVNALPMVLVLLCIPICGHQVLLRRAKCTFNQYTTEAVRYDAPIELILEQHGVLDRPDGHASRHFTGRDSTARHRAEEAQSDEVLYKTAADSYVLTMTGLLSVLYCLLCSNNLSVFDCRVTNPDDGFSYLSALGTTAQAQCYVEDGVQQQLVPWAIMSVLIYGVGIPLFLVWVMRRFATCTDHVSHRKLPTKSPRHALLQYFQQKPAKHIHGGEGVAAVVVAKEALGQALMWLILATLRKAAILLVVFFAYTTNPAEFFGLIAVIAMLLVSVMLHRRFPLAAAPNARAGSAVGKEHDGSWTSTTRWVASQALLLDTRVQALTLLVALVALCLLIFVLNPPYLVISRAAAVLVILFVVMGAVYSLLPGWYCNSVSAHAQSRSVEETADGYFVPSKRAVCDNLTDNETSASLYSTLPLPHQNARYVPARKAPPAVPNAVGEETPALMESQQLQPHPRPRPPRRRPTPPPPSATESAVVSQLVQGNQVERPRSINIVASPRKPPPLHVQSHEDPQLRSIYTSRAAYLLADDGLDQVCVIPSPMLTRVPKPTDREDTGADVQSGGAFDGGEAGSAKTVQIENPLRKPARSTLNHEVNIVQLACDSSLQPARSTRWWDQIWPAARISRTVDLMSASSATHKQREAVSNAGATPPGTIKSDEARLEEQLQLRLKTHITRHQQSAPAFMARNKRSKHRGDSTGSAEPTAFRSIRHPHPHSENVALSAPAPVGNIEIEQFSDASHEKRYGSSTTGKHKILPFCPPSPPSSPPPSPPPSPPSARQRSAKKPIKANVACPAVVHSRATISKAPTTCAAHSTVHDDAHTHNEYVFDEDDANDSDAYATSQENAGDLSDAPGYLEGMSEQARALAMQCDRRQRAARDRVRISRRLHSLRRTFYRDSLVDVAPKVYMEQIVVHETIPEELETTADASLVMKESAPVRMSHATRAFPSSPLFVLPSKPSTTPMPPLPAPSLAKLFAPIGAAVEPPSTSPKKDTAHRRHLL